VTRGERNQIAVGKTKRAGRERNKEVGDSRKMRKVDLRRKILIASCQDVK